MGKRITISKFFEKERNKRHRKLIKAKNLFILSYQIDEYFLIKSITYVKGENPLRVYLGLGKDKIVLFSVFKDQNIRKDHKIICFYNSMEEDENHESSIQEWTYNPPSMYKAFLTDPVIIIQTEIRVALMNLIKRNKALLR